MSDIENAALAEEPEAIEAEASVIEAELSPLTGAERWLADARERVKASADKYVVYHIGTPEEYAQAKRERQAIRKDHAELDNERKAMTRQLDDFLKGFRADVKDVLSPLTDLDAGYKQELDRYEGEVIDRRRAALRQAYEDAAPDIALPQEGADAPLVPFERLLERYGQGQTGKKWLLFGTSEGVATTQMNGALAQIAQGEKTIDSMVDEEDRDAVKATYFATLDMDAAMRDAMERKAQRERLAKLEAERKAREEERRRIEEDARLAAEKAEAERRAEETRQARKKAEADYAAGVRTGVLDMPGVSGGTVTEAQARALEAVKNGATPQQASARPIPQPTRAAPGQPTVPMPGSAKPATWVFAGYGNEMQKDAFIDFCRQHGIGRHTEVPTNGKQYKLTTR